jgi:N-glycosylase/DNA lyase
MKQVIRCVQELKRDAIKDLVERRKKQFKAAGRGSSKKLFKEMCFCILTANYTAEGGIRIQKEVGDGFLMLTERQLARRLKSLGHRFPNTRAGYIVSARQHVPGLKKRMNSFSDPVLLRGWLAQNVKGLGMKEASHFLRNVGYEDVAIVDFHIVDFLVDHGVVDKPKTLTPRKYLEIEDVLRRIGNKAGMTLGELDLYMWYCETGKILK